jgi:hypothetical protein
MKRSIMDTVLRNNPLVQEGNSIFDVDVLAAFRQRIGRELPATPEKKDILSWCESRAAYIKRSKAVMGINVPMHNKEGDVVVATFPDHMEYLLTKGYLPEGYVHRNS